MEIGPRMLPPFCTCVGAREAHAKAGAIGDSTERKGACPAWLAPPWAPDLGVLEDSARDSRDSRKGPNPQKKVMGVLNEEYLVKLRADTRRGLQGRVERKLFAGGTPYGYRTEQVPSGSDASGGSRLVIDPDQAQVIRGIFKRYNRGEGLRAISHALNADSVPPPRA